MADDPNPSARRRASPAVRARSPLRWAPLPPPWYIWLVSSVVDFPTATFGAAGTTLILMSVALVAVGPYARTSRDLQRRWNEARVAASDGMKKFTALQQAIDQAKASGAELDELTPNNAVHVVRRVRTDVGRAIESIDLAMRAFDALEERITQLVKHHRDQLLRVRPDFGEVVARFEEAGQELKRAQPRIDAIREAGSLEQLDAVLDLAIQASTNYAIARSAALLEARAGEGPNPARAFDALKKVHDFARAHGVKLAG